MIGMINMYKKRAFSLIELLVSLSIISMLTVLFLANYRSANRRTDLVMTAQVLVTDIRYAQANALGLKEYQGAMPEGGWGVSFSTAQAANNRYIIFADTNGNGLYDIGEANENLGGREVFLPNNIVIDELILGGAIMPTATVTFLPPDPKTFFRSGGNVGFYLEIRLKEKLDNTVKTVRVNFLGLVEVIDPEPEPADQTIDPINM
jgi:prepilin-type N-terminal cleavage/methylation domain-containing protein